MTIFHVLMVLVSFLPVLYFIHETDRIIMLNRRGVKAMGKIVSIDITTGESGGETAHPTIEFTTHDQIRIRSQIKFGTVTDLYEEDQEIEVLYDPSQPKRFVINSFFEKYINLFAFGMFSILSIIALITFW